MVIRSPGRQFSRPNRTPSSSATTLFHRDSRRPAIRCSSIPGRTTTAENLPSPPPSVKTQLRPESADHFRRRVIGQVPRSRLKVANRVVCTLSGNLRATCFTSGSSSNWRLRFSGCEPARRTQGCPGATIPCALRQCSDLGHLERDLRILRIQQHPVAALFRTTIDERSAAVDANVNDFVSENYLQGEGAVQPIDSIYPLIVQAGDPVTGRKTQVVPGVESLTRPETKPETRGGPPRKDTDFQSRIARNPWATCRCQALPSCCVDTASLDSRIGIERGQMQSGQRLTTGGQLVRKLRTKCAVVMLDQFPENGVAPPLERSIVTIVLACAYPGNTKAPAVPEWRRPSLPVRQLRQGRRPAAGARVRTALATFCSGRRRGC